MTNVHEPGKEGLAEVGGFVGRVSYRVSLGLLGERYTCEAGNRLWLSDDGHLEWGARMFGLLANLTRCRTEICKYLQW